MEPHRTAAATCSECHSTLNTHGRCLPCLLRGGLSDEFANETVAEGDAPVPPPPTDREGTAYGDFEITRRDDGTLWELGRGAMGVTYRAVDRHLHRAVALKVIQFPARAAGGDGASVALRERFLREARAAAALQHPSIAGIYHFGVVQPSGRCFYAMELVEGETLEARVRRAGPLDADATLAIASQVAAALVEAAGRGLIHRDLKPSNLMLANGGLSGRPEVKVIDFGLAKAAAAPGETDLTHGGFVGTPAYASPEQFERGKVDARSDIYSLGVTLWYALTGKAPFGGKTLDELRHHPARAALPAEQLKARKVPPALVALLYTMLAADPAQRPGSARELATALEKCRRAKSGQGDRTAGRPGTAAIALGVVLGIALLGTGLAWWLARPRPTLPAPTHAVAAAAAPDAPEKSVAVLPFANLSADKDNAFFADGVQDEVLTDLAKVADLKVISRTSVMQYRDTHRNLAEIAKALGVAYVVEGSVQRSGNQVRVTAQLIDARTDAHKWAEHYDRPLDNVFTIQSDIAQAIAGKLQAAISPQETAAITELPTRDEVAYELYLRARAKWNEQDVSEVGTYHAILDLLRRATERDPNFARAFALTAEVLGDLYHNWETTPQNAEASRTAAETVARLRPDSSEAKMAMGCYHLFVPLDAARARDEFAEVVRRMPNDSTAYHYLGIALRRLGRYEEALAAQRHGLELDPENYYHFELYAYSLEALHRYAEVLSELDRWLASHPQQWTAWGSKAETTLEWRADPRAAQAVLAHVPTDFDPNGYFTWARFQCALTERDFDAAARVLAACSLDKIANRPREQLAGDAARLRGDVSAANAAYTVARQRWEKILSKQSAYPFGWLRLAEVDASLGQHDLALEEGRRALALVPANDIRTLVETTDDWAFVLTRAGERDEAIRALQKYTGQPYSLGYGWLKLQPDWDPLRGDGRFEALVAALAPDHPATARTTITPPLTAEVPEKSVAVLPFDNFSEDKDSAFFADGVQDEVLTDLAHVADLKVISRSSVMQYKDAKARNLREIGQTLGVAYVVEGSVQRAGGKIKVAAQLIDTRTDAHKWAEHYVRSLDDMFAIQSDIAQAIAGQLQAAISPQEQAAITQAPTHDLQAYAAYLRAREFWSSFDVQDPALFQRTVALAKEATDRDPGFARAYAFAAYVQCLNYRLFDASPAQAAAVRNLVETVARLRPGSGEAHLVESSYRFFVTHEFTGARDEADAAVRLLPNDAGALYLLGTTEVSLGQWEPALAHLRKAAELDPDDGDTMNEYVSLLAGIGRPAEAVAVLDRWIEVHQNRFWAYAYKAEVLLAWKGDVPAARAEFAFLPPGYDPQGVVTAQRLMCDVCARDFAAAERDLAACRSEEIYGVPRAFFQGCVARYRGDTPAATAAFTQARPALAEAARVGPEPGRALLYLATVDAALGRKEDALHERKAGLEKKLPEHNTEGPRMALLGARVLAWADERDEAIRALQSIANTPAGPGYGLLHLDPAWDSLRDDPRFTTMVAALAPRP